MATSVVFPRVQFFANNGRPLIGGRIHTYVAGSSTRTRTYKDAAKVQPNTNPIILDARGEAAIYLAEGVEYKFVIEDSKGALIYTQEPVYGAIWPNAEEWPSDATLSYQYMTEAKAAAGAIGPLKFYDTYAQAMGDAANWPAEGLIEISRDEIHDGARTRYRIEGDVLDFEVNLDQLREELASAEGAKRVGFLQDGVGSVARNAQEKMSDVISAQDFQGDLQKAINAAYGKRLYIGPGTYEITEPLSIVDTISIEFDPGATVDYSAAPAGTSLNQRRAIEVIGKISESISVTSDASLSDVEIQVASTVGLVDGDLIIIRSDQPFMDGVAGDSNGAKVLRGHITRIKTVDSLSQITIDEPLPFSYDAESNARIEKIAPVKGVSISGGELVGGGVGKVHSGIYAYATEGLHISGMKVKSFEDCGISVWYSVGALIEKNIIEDSSSPAPSIGNTGYGAVFYNGTRDSTISLNIFRRCRHAVSGGNQTISLYCAVIDNVANDSSNHAYDCHEPCFWWSFVGNRASGGSGGIIVRGQHTLVQANVLSDMTSSGIRVRSFYDNSDGLSGTNIVDNVLSRCKGGAILIEGTSVFNRVGFSNVSRNQIRFCSQDSIIVWFGINVSITGNNVRSVASFTGSGGSGIRVVGNVENDNVNITINDNDIDRTLRHGINAQFVSGLKLDGNFINRVSVNPISLLGCKKVSVAGGHCIGDQVGNGALISLNQCSRVTIGGGIILQGSIANVTQDGIRAFSSSGTMSTLIVSNAIVFDCGRHAVFSTNHDRVIVTNSDVRDVFSDNKINISDAMSMVVNNNIQ